MVTGGGQPGPFGINTAISRLRRTPFDLIMKLGPLPGPAGRAGSGGSRRQNALDPGVHGVPAGRAQPGRCARTHALDSGVHGARTHWIRGFMAFRLGWRAWAVMRMVPG